MTPYEHLDIAMSEISNSLVIISLAIAVLSGYVVIAYAVGAKLTRAQVVVLNVVYSIWGLFLIASGGVALDNGFTRVSHAKSLLGESPILVPFSIPLFYLIGSMIMLSSLWFMWSVRHPKSE